MAGQTAAELQIIISAQIEEAKAALQSISDTAQQMSQAMTEAGSGASESLSKIQGAASEADTALSGVAGGAQQAASAMNESLAAATEPLQQVAAAADEAKTSLDTLGQGAAEPIQQLEAVAAELTGELQKTAEAASEATTELNAVGEAATKTEEEILSLGEAMTQTKEGIEGAHAAMQGFMVIMGAGMLGEFADNAEKQALAMGQLQSMTGQSSQQIEQLSLVGQSAGLSMDQLSNMVGRMDMRMGRAMSGSSSLAKELNSLGVSAQAFTSANPQQQAQMLSTAIAKANMPAKQLDSTLKTLGVNAQQFTSAAPSQQMTLLANGLQEVQNSGQSVGRMLQDAGINASQFMQLPFSQQLDQIATAFEHTKNRAQATALVMTVFGRQGASMIPLLQNMKEMNDYAAQFHLPKMDFAEMQSAAMKTKMLVSIFQLWATDVMTKILPVVDATAKAFYDMATNLNHPIEMLKKMTADIGPLGTALILLASGFQAMKVINSITSTVKSFTEATKAAAIAAGILGTVETEAGEKTLAFTAIQNLQSLGTKVATAAQVAFNAVMDANPIALVIIAIAALAVGIYELVTHWKTVIAWVKEAWQTIGTWLVNLWQSIVTSITKVWSEIEQTTSRVWNAITAFFKKWGADILLVLLNPIAALVKLLVQHWSTIQSDAMNAWNALVRGIQQIVGRVWGIVSAPFIRIGQFFSNLAQEAFHWGANLIGNVITGVESMVGRVTQAVSNVAHSIASFLGFHSPAEQGPGADADEWAPNLINMYVQGLQAGIPKVQAALNGMLTPMNTALAGVGGNMSLSHSITGSWPASAVPSGASSPVYQITMNVSGNVASSQQELADIVATEFQRKMKMKTQLL